jgi:Scaffold domain
LGDGSRVVECASCRGLLTTAETHSLNSSDYGPSFLDRRLTSGKTSLTPEELVNLDVQITAALLRFGHDVAVGRSDPTAIDPTRDS